jgi:phosphoglycerol transferase MdoB-like AlkP superfamily enzyme
VPQEAVDLDPLIIQSFDCVDQTFSTFFRTFERLALSRTTELVIYGDHMFMEHNYRQLPLHHPRSPDARFRMASAR